MLSDTSGTQEISLECQKVIKHMYQIELQSISGVDHSP